MLRIASNRKAQARSQAGFIVTVELLLVTVVLVVGLVTGMTKLRDQTIAELSDTGSAVGAINQSYSVTGTEWTVSDVDIALASGFAFDDASDPSTGSEVGGDNNRVLYLAAPVPSTVGAGLSEDSGVNSINLN